MTFQFKRFISKRKKQLKKCLVQPLSRVQLFATPWTITNQAPLFIEFSRQEYWSGLALPSPGDVPDTEIKPGFHVLQADC